jgi:hypothetical protein
MYISRFDILIGKPLIQLAAITVKLHIDKC